MAPSLSLVLGVAFAAAGLAAAILQLWLWTFPMEPDPSGRDPNGRTTAPRTWRYVHRVLGYVFAALYVALLAQMLPRAPFLISESGTWRERLHAIAGAAIAPILFGKIWVLRFQPRFGKHLRKVGLALLLLALITIGVVAAPSLALMSLPTASLEEESAKEALRSRCMGCHGASPIVSRSEDDAWDEVLHEMRETARKWGRPDPVGGDAAALVRFLEAVLPRTESQRDSRKDSRGRGKERRETRPEED